MGIGCCAGIGFLGRVDRIAGSGLTLGCCLRGPVL
jgi:hypothetical protein